MRILVGFEESQAVTKELRKLGHEAFSCDLLPCSGGHPEWHLQGDFFEVYKTKKWDKTITFQPCTDLTLSGARHFEKKRNNGIQRESIKFFFNVWKVSNCSENPIGIMNGGKYIKQWFPLLHKEMVDYGFPFKPSQIIQPWQFGDKAQKTTCLWLKDLPLLKHTEIVEKGEFFEFISKKGEKKRMAMWYYKALQDAKTPAERSTLRSKTFPGIAEAMAKQWTTDQDVQDSKQIKLYK